MDYKAVILDIDGTILGRGAVHPTEAVLSVVEKLQQKGIKVIIATGRSYFVANEKLLCFRADYTVCANGAYIVDENGEHLYDEYMTSAQVERLIALADEKNGALGFAFSDGNYVYRKYAWFAERYSELVGDIPYVLDGEARNRHLQDMPYAAFGGFVPDSIADFAENDPEMSATPYAPGMYDIFRRELNKAKSIALLLQRIGLTPEQAVAVGDGINDREMLMMAGYGVAMGNARDELKQIADLVTDTVEQDGAAKAMCELFGLEP